MKTKDFIKMLQDADPSGEAYLRMEGGIPLFAEHKPGYWDGPYSYVDEDGNYVYSTKGSKVDIHCIDLDGFVERNFNIYEENNWEKIKSMFKFELTYSIPEQRKEREDSIINSAKKYWDEYFEWQTEWNEDKKKKAIENSENGWIWFQNKLVDDESLKPNMHHYYTWKVYDKDGKEQSSNPYNVEAVYKSGLFERLDNDVKPGYYQWVLK
jgi:hypothetical protein